MCKCMYNISTVSSVSVEVVNKIKYEFSKKKFAFFLKRDKPMNESYHISSFRSLTLTFSYFLLQGKVLCFARIGKFSCEMFIV